MKVLETNQTDQSAPNESKCSKINIPHTHTTRPAHMYTLAKTLKDETIRIRHSDCLLHAHNPLNSIPVFFIFTHLQQNLNIAQKRLSPSSQNDSQFRCTLLQTFGGDKGVQAHQTSECWLGARLFMDASVGVKMSATVNT